MKIFNLTKRLRISPEPFTPSLLYREGRGGGVINYPLHFLTPSVSPYINRGRIPELTTTFVIARRIYSPRQPILPVPVIARRPLGRRGNPFLFLWIATPDYIRFAMTTFCSSPSLSANTICTQCTSSPYQPTTNRCPRRPSAARLSPFLIQKTVKVQT